MVHDIWSVLIIFMSIFILLISLYLLKMATGFISKPTISVYFFWNYIVFAFIGSVIFNTVYIEHYAYEGIYDRVDLLFDIWIKVMLGAIVIPIGMIIANYFWKCRGRDLAEKFFNQEKIGLDGSFTPALALSIIGLFSISIFTFLIYYNSLQTLPILGILNETSALELARLRSEATNDFQGRIYLVNLFTRSIPLFLVIIFFFLRERNRKYYILYWILLVFNVFTSIMTLAKAPVLIFILTLILCRFYEKRKLHLKKILSMMLIAVTLLVLTYSFFMLGGVLDIENALLSAFRRIFLGQIYPMYWYEIFVERFGLLYGASFPNPGSILPFQHRAVVLEVMLLAHPELARMGLVGTMPTVFFADGYINFGFVGMVFTMFFFGFIAQSIDLAFLRTLIKKKGFLTLAFYIYMIIYMSKYALTLFFPIFLDEAWIIILIIYWSFIVLSRTNIRNIGKT